MESKFYGLYICKIISKQKRPCPRKNSSLNVMLVSISVISTIVLSTKSANSGEPIKTVFLDHMINDDESFIFYFNATESAVPCSRYKPKKFYFLLVCIKILCNSFSVA